MLDKYDKIELCFECFELAFLVSLFFTKGLLASCLFFLCGYALYAFHLMRSYEKEIREFAEKCGRSFAFNKTLMDICGYVGGVVGFLSVLFGFLSHFFDIYSKKFDDILICCFIGEVVAVFVSFLLMSKKL